MIEVHTMAKDLPSWRRTPFADALGQPVTPTDACATAPAPASERRRVDQLDLVLAVTAANESQTGAVHRRRLPLHPADEMRGLVTLDTGDVQS